MDNLSRILKNIYLFEDIVNVYIIKDGNEAILIDFGFGKVLNYLASINVSSVDYILHTHYHRDQCFGDKIAIEKGIKIASPHGEKKLFENAEDYWKTRSFYDIYYFKPTFFVSTQDIPLDLTLKNGKIFKWRDHEFKIVKTDGHTNGSLSYVTEIDGKKIAFTGDLIHHSGKIITYYDLEYFYNDNGEGGFQRSLKSFKRLLSHEPEILLPSHGKIIEEPINTINILKQKFEQARDLFCSRYSAITMELPELKEREIKPVNIEKEFPHLYHECDKPPFIIIGEHQNCFIMDFVGDDSHGYTMQELNTILKKRNINKIDFIIPTHHHDDHTAGIAYLKEKFKTKVFALEEMVDVLENPIHYRLGCLIDTPIKVDRVLKDGEKFTWEDHEFQVFHFPGQTEYHMGLFGEIDGKKIFFSGDTITQRTFVDNDININGLNFCRLGDGVGYMKCADILLKCKPEYLAISHHGIIKVKEEQLRKFKELVSKYEPLISNIVAQENPNMGLDPNWISFKPIRVITQVGKSFKTNLLIRNYLDKKVRFSFELNLPEGWKGKPDKNSLYLEPNSQNIIPLEIFIPKNEDPNGRTIITANVSFNDKELGPFPDLTVDHGFMPSDFWTGWNPNKEKNLFTWILEHIKHSMSYFK